MSALEPLPIKPSQLGGMKVEPEFKNGILLVKISGKINEDVNFEDLIKIIFRSDFSKELRAVAFDVIGVNMINSCGVRAWLLFIEKVQANANVMFARLNETFIELASVTPNLMGKKGTRIVEFETPYFCEKCNERHVMVMKAKGINRSQMQLPERHCPKCQSLMEFDAIPEEYFQFLKYTD